MEIQTILPIIQIVLAVILIVSVLLQQSEAGAGGAFGGGSSDSVSSWRTRRGFEKTLFIATIVIGILFIISSFIALRIA
jgi:preprotein translocase subunit SecG